MSGTQLPRRWLLTLAALAFGAAATSAGGPVRTAEPKIPLEVEAGGVAWHRTRASLELTGKAVQLWLDYCPGADQAAAVSIGITYHEHLEPRPEASSNVAGLAGIFRSSSWEEESPAVPDAQQVDPDQAGTPAQRLLRGEAGDAEYRIRPFGANDPVPLLAALLTPDAELYRLNVIYPADCSIEQGGSVLPGPLGPPDIFQT
ncbi:MAG: hypothetical protein HY303_11695, partial [Candidatus Wallbacteria bacterium]|nr:hypothetical protein [Candidatus Wallbacteria bacterium]